MKQVLRGNIIHAPEMGRLEILEHGCMVLEDGQFTWLDVVTGQPFQPRG